MSNSPKFTAQGKRRLEKLNGIFAKLTSGQNVQNRDLQTWLTADEYKVMEEDWVTQKTEFRDIDKPDAIKKYEAKLRKAIMLHNRADNLSAKKKSASAKKLFDKAENEFEGLIERLQEIVGADPNAALWFDRPLEFGADSQLSPDPIGIPRVITSRSLDRQGEGILAGKRTKLEVKRQAVERAIEKLSDGDIGMAEREQEAGDLLKEKLKKLRSK